MPNSIAIDWGSSAFRAFLLDDTGRILDRKSTADGVLTIKDASFADVIAGNCGEWLGETPTLPINMSGAIGSRNGWREAPYVGCAASVETLAMSCVTVANDAGWVIQIVPGVNGPNFFDGADVMRGEETQVFGALSEQGLSDALICLPGTHSKWCVAEGARITSLTTFMTGEMFALIRRQSSVGLVIEDTGFDEASFLAGLAAAKGSAGLLHKLFSVRADILLGNLKSKSAESYLSGLLVGCEIEAVVGALGGNIDVLLVGNDALTQRYALALAQHGGQATVVSADAAFVRGTVMVQKAQGLKV